MQVTDSQVERVVRALEQVGTLADWIGLHGDGHGPGVLEANAIKQERAIREGFSEVAEALREGLSEIATATRSKT